MNLAATLAPKPAVAAPARAQLSDAMFQKFATLVYDLSGMRFEASKNYFLASKIDNRVQALGLKSFEAYLGYIDSPSGRTEHGYLMDEVTINETFFFRHEPQLQAFRDAILQPMLFARRAARRLTFRILSAASSTGDELYTLALMLQDMGVVGKDIMFELVGTDISHDVVTKAKQGVYKKYNIRNVPAPLLQKFFKHDGSNDTWTLAPEIRTMCKFQEGNLMDTTRCQALGKFDIIFCRNVLIYFDENGKEIVCKNLASMLSEDGFVLMGHSENVYGQRHILRPDKAQVAAIAYTKAPPGTPKLS
jgi:chemotaxis protein methyltransferase CheR